MGEIKIRHYLVCYQNKRIMKLTYVLTTSIILSNIKILTFDRFRFIFNLIVVSIYNGLIYYVGSTDKLYIKVHSGGLETQIIRPSCIIVSLTNNVLF